MITVVEHNISTAEITRIAQGLVDASRWLPTHAHARLCMEVIAHIGEADGAAIVAPSGAIVAASGSIGRLDIDTQSLDAHRAFASALLDATIAGVNVESIRPCSLVLWSTEKRHVFDLYAVSASAELLLTGLVRPVSAA